MQDKTQQNKEKQQTIETLVVQIKKHQEMYYNGIPEISDSDFDALWDRLRSLDPSNTILKQVGKDSSKFFPKKQHIMPMGSLSKAADSYQFKAWVAKHPSSHYVVEYKLDGASLELQYEKGTLSAAVSRGDGKIGDDILMNARNMQGVLRSLAYDMTCAIRCEVIMTHQVFKKHFSSSENTKANCRNAANGIMKKKNGVYVELLQCMCYDIWFSDEEQKQWEAVTQYSLSNEKDKLELLKALGFIVVPYWVYEDEASIDSLRNSTIQTRESIGYDIDGLVIKMCEYSKIDMSSLLPDRQLAYKFPLEQQVTKLRGVEWSASGHLYTPIALLDPVPLAGTIVKRANLVHPDHIKELGLKIGSEVMVAKRGEIIPKVEKVVHNAEGLMDITLPTICEVCGATIQSDGTTVFCPNVQCRKRLLFRIKRWIQIHEIPYWGDTLVHTLVLKQSLVHKIGDLYRLSVDALMKLDRVAKPLAEKLYNAMHSKKSVSLAHFIASLGIDGIALLSSESIVRTGIFHSIDDMFSATVEQLESIENIGAVLAKNIIEAMQYLKEEIIDVAQIVNIETPTVVKTAISNMSFCFTGTLSAPRKQLQDLVKKQGGIVKNTVSEDLSYLVTNSETSTSSKMKDAKEKGVAIISEEEFLALLSQ